MKAKPIEIKDGNVIVKIYRRIRKKGKARYQTFDVADYSTGRRKFISFADEQEARAKAQDIAEVKKPEDFGVRKLVGDERIAYEAAEKALAPLGIKIDVAAIEYADIIQKLGNVPPAVA